MNSMLWFDNDPNTKLEDKVKHAADYFKQKYGHLPTLCLIHPSMVEGNIPEVRKITIRPDRAILPGHLCLFDRLDNPKIIPKVATK